MRTSSTSSISNTAIGEHHVTSGARSARDGPVVTRLVRHAGSTNPLNGYPSFGGAVVHVIAGGIGAWGWCCWGCHAAGLRACIHLGGGHDWWLCVMILCWLFVMMIVQVAQICPSRAATTHLRNRASTTKRIHVYACACSDSRHRSAALWAAMQLLQAPVIATQQDHLLHLHEAVGSALHDPQASRGCIYVRRSHACSRRSRMRSSHRWPVA